MPRRNRPKLRRKRIVLKCCTDSISAECACPGGCKCKCKGCSHHRGRTAEPESPTQ